MMKYKLIKEYPGSPKIGFEMDMESKTTYFTYNNSEPIQMKDYPEYWQEVVEKDYEILTVICTEHLGINPKGTILQIDDKGHFWMHAWTAEEIVNLSHFEIHSVKRVSDGEVFVIGDSVRSTVLKYNGLVKIEEFEIVNTKMQAQGAYFGFNLNSIAKNKKPLFTTEDGVDIFENNSGEIIYWPVEVPNRATVKSNEWRLGVAPVIIKNIIPHSAQELKQIGTFRFSTKEAAEEYILMNKPCLSVIDVRQIVTSRGYAIDELKRLVKNKI